MKRVLLGIGGLACAASIVGGLAVAHAQTLETAPIIPAPEQKGGLPLASGGPFKNGVRESPERKEGEKGVDILLDQNTSLDLATSFQSLARMSGVQIIVADDVKGRSKTVVGRNVLPQAALEAICNANNLAWGKAGANTYLVVKQNTRSIRVTTDLSRYYRVLPKSAQPGSGQPPQANQENFRLWLLDRK